MKSSKRNRVQRTRPLLMHKRGVMLHCNLENESNTRYQIDIPNQPEIPNPDPIDILDVQGRVSSTRMTSSTSNNAPVRKIGQIQTWTVQSKTLKIICIPSELLPRNGVFLLQPCQIGCKVSQLEQREVHPLYYQVKKKWR